MHELSALREQPLILIVDDEQDIVDLVKYNLKKEKYDTITASNGVEGLAQAKSHHPDLIVLDIMMPSMDGIEMTRKIRENASLKEIPILMLTAKDQESDHISGLETGADIYLVKPISIPVLLSQVKALLRGRGLLETSSEVLSIGELVINRERFEAQLTGSKEPIHLARKEFELLYFLASKPGKVYSRADLLDKVWGHDVYVADRTVDVHVRKIREKIGDKYIETVKGVGYRMAARLDS